MDLQQLYSHMLETEVTEEKAGEELRAQTE